MAANPTLQKLATRQKLLEQLDADAKARIKRIFDGGNEVQKRFWKDKSRYRSLRCPRRSGKSFSISGDALLHGEQIPNARILIISLTLKSTKENFWSGPGGIKFQAHKYELGLTYNETDSVWYHTNGSRGRLAGAETRADIEYLRGAAAEADIVYIDECKSFAPDLLRELIRDIIEPGLMTRTGRFVLAGTPGNIPEGDFFAATQPGVKLGDGKDAGYTCYLFKGTSRKDNVWSLHTWTIADNTAIPTQWEDALNRKKNYRIDDNDPRWRREYLGEWVTDVTELVYAYAKCKSQQRGYWVPSEKTRTNRCGLPTPLSQWRFIMGLDFGFQDDNAIVLAAYSETEKELRQVYEFRQNHMTIDEFGQEILDTIAMFGEPDVIVGDKGSLGGVIYLQELQSRFGISIVEAEKKEKNDFIELMNSDFYAGRILVIYNSLLDHEMCNLQWDFSADKLSPDKSKLKISLTRRGKLIEDRGCPNHLCDAFLYLWRYCYHYWSEHEAVGLVEGTKEWWEEYERKSIESYNNKRFMSTEQKELDNYEFSMYNDSYNLAGDIYDFS